MREPRSPQLERRAPAMRCDAGGCIPLPRAQTLGVGRTESHCQREPQSTKPEGQGMGVGWGDRAV